MSFKDGYFQEDFKDHLSSDEKELFGKDTKLKDRVTAAGNVFDDTNKALNRHKISNASIIARARNSVMQFPIYTVPTIRVNEIHIISKLFEKVYADFVRTVISQHPIIDEDEANNLQFLKQFHTNLVESSKILVNKYYEAIDEIDHMIKESVFHTERLSESCTVEFAAVPAVNDLIISESARLAEDPLAGFGYYFKEADDGTTQVKKTIYGQKVVDKIELINMIDANPTMLLSKQEIKDCKSDEEKMGKAKEKIEGKSNDEKVAMFDQLVVAGQAQPIYGRVRDKDDPNKFKYTIMNDLKGQEITTRSSDIKTAVDTPVFLKDADIKKNNGMAPFNMEVTFRIRNKNGVETKEVKFILGIKTILHIVSTQDLADELRDLVMGNINTLQKVRYKTGEISFLNYLFNIKGLKADALKRTNTNKRWISTLKRLSDYGNMNGSLLKGTNAIASEFTNGEVPIPNGTMILTQADVLYLTQTTGIDLSVISNAKKLMSSLFLIAIAIVDSSAGTMRVLFDKDVNWDVQSLAAIDAEVSKMDNSNLMRELNKMVNK